MDDSKAFVDDFNRRLTGVLADGNRSARNQGEILQALDSIGWWYEQI